MACILTSGVSLGCRDNLGGVQEVYIGDYNGDSLTYQLGTNNIIGTFSGTTMSFFPFEQEIETASFTENGVFSVENGTSFYELTLTINLYKLEASLRNKILILGIRVLTYNGDLDSMCDWQGGLAWVLDLKWKHSEQFN